MGSVVRRYIDILTIIINFPFSTCISSFFGSSISTFFHFLNVFSFLFMLFLYNSKHYLKNIGDRSKKNRDHANIIINYIHNYRRRRHSHASPVPSTCEVPNNV